MPIDTDSEIWKEQRNLDPIRVKIEDLLYEYSDQAHSVKEIEEHIVENHSELFPGDLIGENAIEGAKAARQSIILDILSRKYWRSEVSFKYISGDGENEEGLYFTDDGVGISPIAEIDDVTDPNPDSAFMTLSSRFRKIEQDLDNEVSELEERINFLEHRIHEELGAY